METLNIKQKQEAFIINPFNRVAGLRALIIGAIGLFLSLVLSFFSQLHFNGLLQFAIIPSLQSYASYLAEHLLVWLIPSLLFYVCGLLFSGGKIRLIDVFGTTLFAQLPFLGMNLISFIPTIRRTMDVSNFSLEMFQEQNMFALTVLLLLFLFFFIWTLIWMYKAFKVSCNMKGSRLIACYILSVILGDVCCRLLIGGFFR